MIGAAAAGPAAAAAPAKPAEKEKVKEEEAAADVDMGGLFGDDYWACENSLLRLLS